MTLGADKVYDTRHFVSTLQQMRVRPLVTQNVKRSMSSADFIHNRQQELLISTALLTPELEVSMDGRQHDVAIKSSRSTAKKLA